MKSEYKAAGFDQLPKMLTTTQVAKALGVNRSTISRSRTAQAKNAERDARKRRTDDSASPDWFSTINARVTSRSVTAAIWSAASAGGTSRGNAESAT